MSHRGAIHYTLLLFILFHYKLFSKIDSLQRQRLRNCEVWMRFVNARNSLDKWETSNRFL